MIEWLSFVVVAVASLVGASVVVTTAALGIRLFENGIRARESEPGAGRLHIVSAYILFALCGVLVLFGIYLIVPIFD